MELLSDSDSHTSLALPLPLLHNAIQRLFAPGSSHPIDVMSSLGLRYFRRSMITSPPDHFILVPLLHEHHLSLRHTEIAYT